VLTAFYQTAAQLCFTLLGLWWLVLQTKYQEWIGDDERRRMATSVSLYFLLPGVMSLIALLGADVPALWRTAFAVASAIGAVETIFAWGRAGRHAPRGVIAIEQWVGFALYILIALVALIPALTLSQIFGFAVDPLTTSGLALSLLVLLGVLLAWSYFLDRPVKMVEDS
jgi:hypothetical protein